MTAGGYGNFFIKITEDMPPEARANAELFQRLWKSCTSHEVEAGEANTHGLVNVCLNAAELTPDVIDPAAFAELGRDGYFLSTYIPSPRHVPYGARKQLVVTGQDLVSTRMGIYGLFRRAFGCEWPAPGVENLARAAFRFEKMKESWKPAFAFREVGFAPAKTKEEAEFRIANGLRPAPIPQGLGRDASYALVPPEKYFDEHPEFYAEIDGKRIALKEAWRKPEEAAARAKELGELCPSAPGLAQVIVEAMRETIAAPADTKDPIGTYRRSRAGWLAQEKVLALTPMRSSRICDCAMCRGLKDREQGPAGAWLTLANDVAEKLEAAFPGEGYRVLIHAFGPWLKPPHALKAASNVIVVLFANECDFSRPLGDKGTPQNLAFAEALGGWSNTCEHVWVADCLTSLNTKGGPFPVIDHLQENLRLYAQHNVQGVYYQARGPAAQGDDFSALKYYLAARLLWDPDAPVDALVQRFVGAYYGAAAPAVAEYMAALKPGPGLTPGSPAQATLIEASDKAAPKLKEAASALDAPFKARVEALIPSEKP